MQVIYATLAMFVGSDLDVETIEVMEEMLTSSLKAFSLSESAMAAGGRGLKSMMQEVETAVLFTTIFLTRTLACLLAHTDTHKSLHSRTQLTQYTPPTVQSGTRWREREATRPQMTCRPQTFTRL